MNYLLNSNSPKIDGDFDIKIVLKEHQKAIIQKAIEIENINICSMGVMNDKPGTGKTYSILGLIYYSKYRDSALSISNKKKIPNFNKFSP